MLYAFRYYLKTATGLMILLLFSFYPALSNHIFRFPINRNIIDGKLDEFINLTAGDTIILENGVRDLLILRNINGTKEKAIVIINDTGLVDFNTQHYFGISVRQCNYVKLTGKGNNNIKYGIRILNARGSGLSIGDFSSDIEVENIEIGNPLYSGITAKTEPDCHFNRNSFIQKNTVIHDCYIHDTGNEGMYIGNSFYNGQTIDCNNQPTVVYPPLLKGVKIYNNKVENTGWDGIQVSSAVQTEIYNNEISNDSWQHAFWQMNGIILGEGSTGVIRGNLITNGNGTGIFTNGLGDIYIYDNILLNPAKANSPQTRVYGMYITDKSSLPDMYFYIGNNLIRYSDTQGIYFSCNHSNLNNKIFNNILVCTTNNSNVITDENYINVSGKIVEQCANKLCVTTDQLYFEDADHNNFTPGKFSPLIDAGCNFGDIYKFPDFNQNKRVNGNRIDIGPVESNLHRNIPDPEQKTAVSQIAFPNPIKSDEPFTLNFYNDIPGYVCIQLIDRNGAIKEELYNDYLEEGNQSYTINSALLSYGLNIIQIARVHDNMMVRIIKTE